MTKTLLPRTLVPLVLALALAACGGGGGGGETTPAPVNPGGGTPPPGGDGPVAPGGDTPAPPSPPIATFQADGFSYSPDPVTRGTVRGFARDLAGGAGISSREIGNGATVWYGAETCVGFQSLGTGLVDLKGGTNTQVTSFPWIRVGALANTKSFFIPTMRGVSSGMGPLSAILDPNYQRASELRRFRWGVRVDAAGTVVRDDRGHYDFVMLFEDGTTSHAAWDPATNAPADRLFIGNYRNALDDFTHDVPTQSHFCMMKEQTSQEITAYCPEVPVNNPAGGIRKLCYMGGMLNGPYELKTSAGRTVEAGSFESNRATGGWSFWRDDGSMIATGTVNAQGLATSTWEYFDTLGRKTTIAPFSGQLQAAADGSLSTWLDGAHTDYTYAGTDVLTSSGRVRQGRMDGWWEQFRNTTKLSDQEYSSTDGRLRTNRSFNWPSCGIAPHVVQTSYGDGVPNITTCYALSGTPQQPVVGAQRTCPAASCQ